MTQLTATFTVTIKTKPDGDYYFDHDDLVRNVVPWIEGGLDDRDDIAEVTITEQATEEAHAELRHARAALARIRQMADYWEQHLPEVIRTPAAVSALRAAMERAESAAVSAAVAPPTTTTTHGLSVQHADALWDAVAIPGPHTPTYPEQHERVCRAVRDILDEMTPAPTGDADWDALVREADRLRRDGAALHARADELDKQLAALRRQVSEPADRAAVLDLDAISARAADAQQYGIEDDGFEQLVREDVPTLVAELRRIVTKPIAAGTFELRGTAEIRAAALREAAYQLGCMDYDTDSNDYGYDTYRDAWNGGVMDAADRLRRMADETATETPDDRTAPEAQPLCHTPHYQYPETLCAEPAGHYVRDRNPHAGPLIINGRERGGAAWDEPNEQPMTAPSPDAWRTDPRERLLGIKADDEPDAGARQDGAHQ